MSNNVAETLIGAVVIAAAAGFLWFASQSGELGVGGAQYPLEARFSSAEGLTVGADVRLAGVKVGTLTGLRLDRETYQAVAEFAIDRGIEIPDDSEAKVATEGLLGGTFVEITPGGSPFTLDEGGEIEYTQGAVSLLNLLIKFTASSGSDDAPEAGPVVE